jgi:transposase-like protein
VQILHPFAGSIQQYAEEIADPNRHRPDRCPQCQAHHSLTAHGFYSRTLVDAEFDGSIRVRRYLCRSCKRTVSLLPEFALNRELAIKRVMARIRKCGGKWPDSCSPLVSGRCTFR